MHDNVGKHTRFDNTHLYITRSKTAEQHPDDVDRHHGDGRGRDPPSLVKVGLDLQDGDPETECQDQEDGRIGVEQHKPNSGNSTRWIRSLTILINPDR